MDIPTAAQILEINLQQELGNPPSRKEGERRLTAFQELVKKKYRARVKVLHPDVNPEVSPEAIQDLNRAKEMLLSIKLQDPRPMCGPTVIIIRHTNMGGFNPFAGTSASDTTTTGFF